MSRNSRIRMKDRSAIGMDMLEKRLLQAVDWFTIPAVDGGVALWIEVIDPLYAPSRTRPLSSVTMALAVARTWW